MGSHYFIYFNLYTKSHISHWYMYIHQSHASNFALHELRENGLLISQSYSSNFYILLQLKFTTYCVQSSQKITLDNARATFLEDLAKPSNSLQFSLTAWLFHFETIFTTRSKIETSLHITCHQEWVEIQLWFKTS